MSKMGMPRDHWQPRANPDFDWGKVVWSETQVPLCGACSEFIPDECVPLMLFREDGRGAMFCEACAGKMFVGR